MTFIQSLRSAWQQSNSLLCVGLDPDLAKIPAHLRGTFVEGYITGNLRKISIFFL